MPAWIACTDRLHRGPGEQQVDEDKTQRAQRLAAALRANLSRRKQQARRRTGDTEPQGDGEPLEPNSDKPNSDELGSDRNFGET
jgi:hypothetical protein